MDTKKRFVAAGAFKAKCLSLLDEVAQTGRPLVVTKRGKPVAEVVPVQEAPSLMGSVVREADLVSPVGADWDAAR
jgi:prevent-host-death family protein